MTKRVTPGLSVLNSFFLPFGLIKSSFTETPYHCLSILIILFRLYNKIKNEIDRLNFLNIFFIKFK